MCKTVPYFFTLLCPAACSREHDHPAAGNGKKFPFYRGLLFRSRFVYNLVTWLKLGRQYHARYEIAAGLVEPGDSVLDFCAGSGDLKGRLPKGCRYSCVEQSPEFAADLVKRGIPNSRMNLHEGISVKNFKSDVVIMMISLYQFRDTSLHELLDAFKGIGKRVVVVEEVLTRERESDSLIHRAINYLCAVDYYRPAGLFSSGDFNRIMLAHGYSCESSGGRYAVGIYGSAAPAVGT